MEENKIKILLVEDDPIDVELILYELKRFGFNFNSQVVDTRSEYLEALSVFKPDIILSDYSMPKFDGMTCLLTRNERCPEIPFVVVTGSINEETAVVCIKAGANDYILKDNLKRLGPAVKAAIEHCKIQKEKQQLIDDLKQSENFNRLLVENQADLICRWNTDFSLTFINKAFAEFYKLPKEALLKKNWLELVTEHSKKQLLDLIKESYNSPAINTFEFETITPNGNIHWLEWTNCPLFDNDGNLTAYQSTGRDITHKKYMDEQIQNQLSFIHSMLESIPIPVFYKDTNLKYTGCNSAFAEFIGIRSESLFGKTTYDIAEKKYADIYQMYDLKLLNTDTIQTYESSIKDSQGVLHDVIFKKSPLKDSRNNIIGIIGAFFDITERKIMEAKLKKSEENYRILIENQGEGVGIVDMNERFIYANPAGEEIFEVEPGGLLNHSLYEFVPGNKAIIQKETEKRQKKQKTTYELPIRTAKGNFRHLLVSATPQKNELGEVIGTFGVYRDITERKAIEEALKTSEEKYRLITDNINDLVWVMDLELNSVFVSPSFYRILGYTVEERKSLSTDKLLTPRSYENIVDTIKETVDKIRKGIIKDKNYTVKIEVEQVRKDGSVFWAESNVGALYDDFDNIIGMQGVTRDISERKMAEEILKKSEEKYKNIFENIQDVYYETTMDGNIIEVSPSIALISKYSRDELIGKNMMNFYSDDEIRKNMIIEITEKGYVHDYEIPLKDKDGIIKRCSISSKVIFDEAHQPIKIVGSMRDIEERKKSEQALNESEERYRTFLNATEDFTFLKDENFKYLIVNKRLASFLGKEEKEIIGKTDFELMPLDAAQVCHTSDIRTINSNKVHTMEEFVNNRYFETRKFPVILRNKKLGVGGFIKDLSDLKKAEKIIKEKEERFRLMMENLPLPVLAYKLNTYEVVFINSKFTDVFGYQLRHIIHIKDWLKLAFPEKENRQKIQKILYSSDEVGKYNKNNFEMLVHCSDGNVIIAEIIINIDRNTVFIVFNDITKKKQILNNLESEINKRTRELALINEQLQLELAERIKQEEKLKYSENLNSTTINAINDYIFVLDEKNTIIMANLAMSQYLKLNKNQSNYNINDIIGKNLNEVFKEFEESIINKYDDIRKYGYGFSDHYQLKRHRKTFYYEIKTIPVIDKEKVILIVTSIHDITKLKQVEEEIKNNLHREKELNLLKSRFISVVSHEFRTPLASIQSSIQLIEGYRNKLDEEKIKSLFDGIYSTIRYSNLLLDDISIIGKDESGRLEINYVECDLYSFCKQCMDDTKAMFSETAPINLVYNTEIVKIKIDESILRHILNNILTNAVKYNIKNKPVNFEVRNEASNIVFIIEDSGRGIPEKDMKYIFEPFHRASNVDSIKGTGLGLSIVKRCVEIHNGNIQLKSKLGKGTRVEITIPLND